MGDYVNDSAWFLGLDSLNNPGALGKGFYQWGQNIVNRGGVIQTRQGFANLTGLFNLKPRGLTLVSMGENYTQTYLVACVGYYVFAIPYPFTASMDNTTQIANISFPTTTRAVHFELTVQSRVTLSDGTVISIPPRFVLIIQDGITNPAYWTFQGNQPISGHTDPTQNQTLKGDYMKWIGDRLWVAKGNQLYASDLLNPLQFTEQSIQASGGFFFLPANVTGMGITQDFKSLLVFTHQTTSAFQVGIEDRTQWPGVQDFQRVIFPSIGCASHRTIINQYGMTWWMSHDGLVGLDNALQAYQTSRLQVRDQNMARSKDSLKWDAGGGCAGTYGNFLMFSVPSSSVYNRHTWVMDSGVVDTINQVFPPAWCSNWTGVNPEQWTTGVVNGVQRCFFISYDVVPQGYKANIWEAFIGQRMDVPKDTDSGNIFAKDIACAFESKFYALSPSQYIKPRFFEFDIGEIIGNVHIMVYYSGRRTSYKKILDKKLQATVSGSNETVFDPGGRINIYVPQYRTIRSYTDTHESTDNDTEVQTRYLRRKDKEFSVLVTWTGQMSLYGLRVFFDPEGDYTEGRVEEQEINVREITTEGIGGILGIVPPSNQPTQALTSQFMSPMRPRWVEFPAYDSAVANDVFFVEIPTFTPDILQGYPSNQYPFNVTIATNTPDVVIRYTTTGTPPTRLYGTVYTTPVSVSLGTDLLAIAYRADGSLADSFVYGGTYIQASVPAPTFSVAGGSYPPGFFPVLVAITTTLAGSTIMYTLDGTTPTPTHGIVYSSPVSIVAGTTLQAMAFQTNYLNSTVASAIYIALPQCIQPTFIPPPGQYATFPQQITISSGTNGCNLRYTIDDPNVTQNGTVVIGNVATVSVNAGQTLRAIAQLQGYVDSPIQTGAYTQLVTNVQTPFLDPDGGTFPGNSVTFTFHCATPNATMSYQIGTPAAPPRDPTPADLPHVQDGNQLNIQIGHKIVKTIAFRGDMNNSAVHSAQFDHGTP